MIRQQFGQELASQRFDSSQDHSQAGCSFLSPWRVVCDDACSRVSPHGQYNLMGWWCNLHGCTWSSSYDMRRHLQKPSQLDKQSYRIPHIYLWCPQTCWRLSEHSHFQQVFQVSQSLVFLQNSSPGCQFSWRADQSEACNTAPPQRNWSCWAWGFLCNGGTGSMLCDRPDYRQSTYQQGTQFCHRPCIFVGFLQRVMPWPLLAS